MIRKIIHIDEEKCDGCGLCARACHEGAIGMTGGKARLVREDFCDGFGDCLPACPAGAITFEEREAPAYDKAAAEAEKKERECRTMVDRFQEKHSGFECPGTKAVQFETEVQQELTAVSGPVSRLQQWPVQLKLLPVQASFYEGAKLLIAADCTAYAYAAMHEDFMKGRVTAIGCPKLDEVDYTEKLTEIVRNNGIKSVTIVRMEVPCCGGLQRAAENALKASGKFIPWQVIVISRDGKTLD